MGPDASTSDPCEPPPAGSTASALCLTFSPEAMTFETDPGLDGMGFLGINIYDKPGAEDDPTATELYSGVVPPTFQQGDEISITNLPPTRIVLDSAPNTVYVRVFFVDNVNAVSGGGIGWGTWAGGLDLSNGFSDTTELDPIALTPGSGTSVNLPLVAFRKIEVTVTTSATPVGDGQGALTLLAVETPNPDDGSPAFGFSDIGCVDASSTFTTELAVVGEGPYYVTGILNDLGGPDPVGGLAPGVLVAFDVPADGGAPVIPATVTLGATDYSGSTTIDLAFANPYSLDGAAPPPNSCADLGLLGDAGP